MKKGAAVAVAVAVMTMSSCTRTVQDRTVRAPAPIRQTGVESTMHRQVLNAVDAGEGDVRVRQLRSRVTTNPDDLEARLALEAERALVGLRPEVLADAPSDDPPPSSDRGAFFAGAALGAAAVGLVVWVRRLLVGTDDGA